jgi:predicted acyl esterase
VGGLDEVTNQTLTFETAMDQTVEFSGPVSAHLTFSCNEIDSHIVARVGRVDAAGVYHLLSMGTISPARRRVDEARSTSCEIAIDTDVPQPLTPGEPVTLSFSLTPAPTRLAPGEKLRFDVASRTDLIESDVSHGYVHFNLPAPPYFSRNNLHYGPETYLELRKVRANGHATHV